MSGFNRYIVECKVEIYHCRFRFVYDLIDTLWNVKDLPPPWSLRCLLRFNRYIVECKVFIVSAPLRLQQTIIRQHRQCKVFIVSAPHVWTVDLIDTLWNVKADRHDSVRGDIHDLIDTLWNVKSEFKMIVYGPCVRFNRYIVECKV